MTLRPIPLPYPLDPYGFKSTSQNDEDGIINVICSRIPMAHYFVEFGVDPHEGNCIALKALGWPGLFMDISKGTTDGDIKKEWVSASNINELLYKYHVPQKFGVLSIDIDGQDYWVWQAIIHRPVLVVIEYNGKLAIDQDAVIPRDDNFIITSHVYGASLLALYRLGDRKHYQLVYANGVNAFFVLRSELPNWTDFRYEEIYRRWPTEHINDPKGFIRPSF